MVRKLILPIVAVLGVVFAIFMVRAGNKPPKVSLAVSGANPGVAPAAFTLEASASDADGSVRKVTFFRDSLQPLWE